MTDAHRARPSLLGRATRDHRTDAPQIIGWTEAAPAFSGWQRALLRIGRVQRFLRLHRAGAP